MSHPETPKPGARSRAFIIIAVAAVFAALIGAKIGDSVQPKGGTSNAVAGSAATTGESTNAIAAYESALASGKPVFLSFGKTGCPSCAKMTEVVNRVMPEYADDAIYLKALVDEPSGQQLASRFSFQYIPASFFVTPDGAIVDSFVGVMEEAQMRAYLDALVAK